MSQNIRELIEKFIDARNGVTSFCELNPLINESLGKYCFIHRSLIELLTLGQEKKEESYVQTKTRRYYMRDWSVNSNTYYKQILSATLHKINEMYFQEE